MVPVSVQPVRFLLVKLILLNLVLDLNRITPFLVRRGVLTIQRSLREGAAVARAVL
ncbi:MAG: hypothetical protein Ct9H90mP25_5950 [Gammaproteobacteria bacterium]|nr:MAG: hypothetical protein Ct9H90mP25_5950 [Gammaproteobacteria bacterium]